MTQIERRSEPRVQVAYAINYEYFVGGVKIGDGVAKTVDLSEHGALVQLPAPVDMTASLILWIHAPFYTLLVKGNVVHARKTQEGSFLVGVRLTDFIEGNWDHLKKDIRSRLTQPQL